MLSVDLADENAGRYVFREHRIPAGAGPLTWGGAGRRSFVVIAGEVALATPDAAAVVYGPLAGWHADSRTAAYQILADGPATLLEAGTDEVVTSGPADQPPVPLGDYRVAKPWGFEIWYTANLVEPPYAVKQIHMSAGHRSSLQSHERKAETNYIVAGKAVVLNGGRAPADRTAAVDPGDLPRSTHGPGSHWSSPPGMLHRVIADHDYTAIEVSTPELDDVIRWGDDSGRGSGRIAAEHGPRP